jgi:hypothetical protein
MLHLLAAAVVLLSTADHFTTYWCLTADAPGLSVSEGNPLAAWLFERLGMVPGLLFDSAVTIAAVTFLVVTHRFSRSLKLLLLGCIVTTTAWAVANNVEAMWQLGLLGSGPA